MIEYKTIRLLEKIPKSNHKNLVDIRKKNSLDSYFKSLKGKEIIILENPTFSKKNHIASGVFSGGILEDIQHYVVDGKELVNIYFKGGNYSKLENIYDVMMLETLKQSSRLKRNKKFHFCSNTIELIEDGEIVSSDHFMAYAQLKKNSETLFAKHRLVKISSIEDVI